MSHHIQHNGESLICHSILDGNTLTRVIETNYNLSAPIQCSLFNRGINDVYVVVAQGKQYILRISRVKRYGYFDEHAYRFEMDLLHFLHKKDVPVAYPLPRRDNEMLGAIHAPEGTRYYALFTYAEGQVLSSMTQEHSHILGQTLAKFHLIANEFSSAHPRFHLDEEYLINEPLRRLRTFPHIAEEDIEFLETLCETLSVSLQKLSRQPHEYGIIHGDIWWSNVHFAARKATLFDFDYCGYGWRISDIASLRGNAKMYGYPLSDDVMASFLNGYQSIRPLTEHELIALTAFEKITVIWAFGVWTTGVDVLGTRWFYETFAKTFSNLKRWVEEGA